MRLFVLVSFGCYATRSPLLCIYWSWVLLVMDIFIYSSCSSFSSFSSFCLFIFFFNRSNFPGIFPCDVFDKLTGDPRDGHRPINRSFTTGMSCRYRRDFRILHPTSAEALELLSSRMLFPSNEPRSIRWARHPWQCNREGMHRSKGKVAWRGLSNTRLGQCDYQ